MDKKFQDLERFTSADVDAALKRNDPAELPLVPITVALLSAELAQAQDACLKLSMHENPNVRGNAVACLGHLARRFRRLEEQRVKPVIEASLHDADESVRALAKSAADEIHQFLGWDIAGHVYG